MIHETSAAMLAAFLQDTFRDCGDFNIRTILCAGKDIYLANIGNFSGRDYISENVIKPLVTSKTPITDDNTLRGILCASEVSVLAHANDAVTKVLGGNAVVFADVEGGVTAYSALARNDPGRSVNEPENETVVRGPREGFIEKAEDNVALLRKRFRTPDFKVKSLQIGKYSDTTVKVAYLEGVCDKALVEDLLERLSGMTLDTVMDSGYLEQYLSRGAPRLFTEIGNSEKPDKVAAKIAEGRVAILCDGSPVVLTVPYLFVESLQSAEDYLKTPYYATFVRILRFVSMLISLYFPAFYIAVMEFHPNAVPATLFKSMTEARSDVPFSVFGEVVVILLIFELIREVGVRMPGAVGNAVGIVGGLILGDAAISAGISSAPVIMVASLTAICTFMLPPYMNSTVLVRLINLVAARLFGMVGIALSLAVLLVHLAAKTSFGVPYLAPFTPFDARGIYDSIYSDPKKSLDKT